MSDRGVTGQDPREAKIEASAAARSQWSDDPCGAVYGRAHGFGTREFFDEVERHRYKEYAPWMPDVMGFDRFTGRWLLEVGCGMGTDLLQFARGGAICTGVDLTPRSIEISKHRFNLYDVRADFLLSDAEQLPFANESFDVYYSNGVLHHTPETAVAIREAYRVLRPGGTAKVMLYHRNSWGYWVELMFRHGLLRGELFRGLSPAEIMGKYVEHSETEARPLVKVYSRREVRNLFSRFREVRVEVDQMIRSEIYFVGGLLPDAVFDTLRRRIGWNVIVTAIK